MFLPFADSPNPRGIPWVTGALIAANVLVFLACTPLMNAPCDPRDPAFEAYLKILADREGPQLALTLAQRLTAYDLLIFRFGFKPATPAVGDLFASMFLHSGIVHLGGNMLFLWIFGNNCEDRLGRVGMVLAYLGTGIAAAFGDAALRLGSPIPTVGASGAISGVLGLYFIWFPGNVVRVFVFLPMLVTTAELSARIVLGAYVLVDNLLPVVLGAGSGVSHGAHLGGFAGGALLAWLLDKRLHTSEGVGSDGHDDPIPELLARARRALDRDQPVAAFQHVKLALELGPDDAERAEAEALLRELATRTGSVPRRFRSS